MRLAKALAKEAERPDREARKSAARARMVENFTLDRAVERFAALYEAV